MEQTYLDCLNCGKRTKHAVFADDVKLPKDKALVQCYECEEMQIKEIHQGCQCLKCKELGRA